MAVTPRRPRGTGALIVRRDSGGRETYYGKWWVGERQVMRRIGHKRASGGDDGLTQSGAERELRRLIDEVQPSPVGERRFTLAEVGERYLRHLDTLDLKKSTLMDYRSTLHVHLEPFFAGMTIDAIDDEVIEAFMRAKRQEGKAPKSILNYLGFMHSVFTYAQKKKWATGNPVKLVDKPRPRGGDPDIRFLDQEELDAVVAAVPNDLLGPTDRTLYLTAAMTGLRQGELLALRWRDVDWMASRVRVRQNYVRGEFGTPKSKRSSRSVPLADKVAGELERHFQRSRLQGDDDLVFCHPLTGKPYDRSKLLKRFKAALTAGEVREVRFHDLRHTFGTRMAAASVSLRTLQEWLGHRDFKTTLIYADYQPGAQEAELVERAFAPYTKPYTKLSETQRT